MLKTWSELQKETSEPNSQKRTIIWNNKEILIAGKSVFYKEFANAGIYYVDQLYRDDGQKVTWEYIKNLGVPQSSILRWFGLINAIPVSPGNQTDLNMAEEATLEFGNDSVPVSACSTKIVTKKITENVFIKPRSETYFSHVFNMQISSWDAHYQLPLKITIDTKLRDFQLKILHNILMTNVKLFKMKIPSIDNSLCTFCKREEETLIHLFCECVYVKLFWENFCMLWGRKLGLNNSLETWQIVLGDPALSILSNFLILLGKRFIYIRRCKKENVDFIAYKSFVQVIQKIEYNIANRKSKLNFHLKKWGSFLRLVG